VFEHPIFSWNVERYAAVGVDHLKRSYGSIDDGAVNQIVGRGGVMPEGHQRQEQ